MAERRRYWFNQLLTFSNRGDGTPFFPVWEMLLLYKPFDRKQMLMYIDNFIKAGYGHYKDIVSLTLKDLIELEVVIKSKQDEEKLSQAL